MIRYLILIAYCNIAVSLAAFADSSNSIFVGTFNAENLFDIKDDNDNPRDDTYLPKVVKDYNRDEHDKKCDDLNSGFYKKQCIELDWSEDVFTSKLKAYADVIKAMPQLPAILVVPETENKYVLEQLVQNFLPDTNYKVVQLDTSDKPDSRGIDVGLLTYLPIKSSKSHIIDFGKDAELCGKTRDMLEVVIELPDGDNLYVFGVHFPSGRSPVKCRYRALKNLNSLASNLPEGSLKVAAGDFNFNCTETSSAAFERLLQRGNWYVSPIVRHGCTSPGSSKYTDNFFDYWHTWSYLDLVMVSKELSPTKPSEKNWFADLGSFQTLIVDSNQYMVDEQNKGYIEPRRFDPIAKKGVSDHFPVGLRLLKRRP